MTISTDWLLQDATYWPPSSNDGYGNEVFGAPQSIKVRWQRQNVLFRDSQGKERVSTSVVYSAVDVAIGGYLFEGTSSATDPRDVAGAYQILQTAVSPNLDNTDRVRKSML